MDLNRILSFITVVGLVGLLVLHPTGAASTINAAGGQLNQLIKTTQAAGVASSG